MSNDKRRLINEAFFKYVKSGKVEDLVCLIEASEFILCSVVRQSNENADDIRQEIRIKMYKNFFNNESLINYLQNPFVFLFSWIRRYANEYFLKYSLLFSSLEYQTALDLAKRRLEYCSKHDDVDYISIFETWCVENSKDWYNLIEWCIETKLKNSSLIISAKILKNTFREKILCNYSQNFNQLHSSLIPEIDLILRDEIRMFYEDLYHEIIKKHHNISLEQKKFKLVRKTLKECISADFSICTDCWSWENECVCQSK